LNYYFIDFTLLTEAGLLQASDYENIVWSDDERRVDYGRQFAYKIPILKKAFARFDKTNKDWIAFLAEGKYKDFALFMTLKSKFSYAPWTAWEEPYKTPQNIPASFYVEYKEEIDFWQFTQYIFLAQWNALRQYAKMKGISIMGDMPLYVSDDSVEVWANPELFMLDENGRLKEVAGVPPDYFSETGQLWGNPLYNWDEMKKDGYKWWTNRLRKALSMYDYVRIDHFRGFDRFYAIPEGMTDAKIGRWYDGPKEALFEDKLDWNIVAEDLGLLDDGVYRLMKNTGFPRMKILQFAFDGNPEHEYKPSNYGENCVVYTGTHDNATFIEYIEDLPAKYRKIFFDDLRKECAKFGIELTRNCKLQAAKAVVQLAYLSKARFVIMPLQDLLLLGRESRINHPGTLGTWNWSWRLKGEHLKKSRAQIIAGLVKKSGR
jgi:4-alpha-glucanotransferase